MSYNGSGTFVLNVGGYPYVSGTVISSTNVNALLQDIANGLSICVTRDGQMTMTGPLNMGAQAFTTTGGFNWKYGASTIMSLSTAGVLSGLTGATITGEVTIAAPTSGDSLYIDSVDQTTSSVSTATGGALNISSNGGAVSSGGMAQFGANNGTSKFAAIKGMLTNGTTNSTGDLSFSLRRTPTDATLTEAVHIAGGGNFTINAPAVGTALTVSDNTGSIFVGTGNQNANISPSFANASTGASAGTILTVSTSSTGNAVSTQLAATGGNGYVGTSNAFPFYVQTNAVSRISVSSTGGVTVNGATAGDTLAVGANTTQTSAATCLIYASGGATGTGYALDVIGNTNTNNPAYVRFMNNAYSQVNLLLYADNTAAYIATGIATTMYLQTNNTTRLTLGNTGNVTIAAPASGTALTVNGFSNTTPLVVASNYAGYVTMGNLYNANAGGSASFLVGANNNAIGALVQADTGGSVDFGSSTNHQVNFFQNDTAAGSINTNKQWTINGATANSTLTVSANTTQTGATTCAIYASGGATGTGYALDLVGSTNTNNPAYIRFLNNAYTQVNLQIYADDTIAIVGTGIATPLYLQTNSVSRITIGSTGNITLAAPSSGIGLTVNAVSGTHSTKIGDSANNLLNAGFLELPVNTAGATYTAVLADSGKALYYNGAVATTYTIPANASVAYPTGTTLTFVNDASAAVNMTIAITTDVLVLSTNGSTGSRTLAQYGRATAHKVTATRWIISGTGLT